MSQQACLSHQIKNNAPEKTQHVIIAKYSNFDLVIFTMQVFFLLLLVSILLNTPYPAKQQRDSGIALHLININITHNGSKHKVKCIITLCAYISSFPMVYMNSVKTEERLATDSVHWLHVACFFCAFKKQWDATTWGSLSTKEATELGEFLLVWLVGGTDLVYFPSRHSPLRPKNSFNRYPHQTWNPVHSL